MAKKKTAEKAKIEAAPVLRSGGDDPTPETPVITKSYIMRDDWKDNGVVNTVSFKSVDGEVQDLLVNGEPAGGGGGTASAAVTITNNSGNEVTLDFAYMIDGMIGKQIIGPVIIADSETQEYQIPLYDGENNMLFMGSVTVTGSITFNDNVIKIAGDGTITIA